MVGRKMMRRITSFQTRAIVAWVVSASSLVTSAAQDHRSFEQARSDVPASQQTLMIPRVAIPSSNPQDATSTPVREQSQAPVRQANQLRATPLASLTVTRERPIFSALRRTRVPAQPASFQPHPSSTPEKPTRPPLILVGAIAGEGEGLAIFLDETTKGMIRLRTGESCSGWVLVLVEGREATLQKGRETAVLALPNPPKK